MQDRPGAAPELGARATPEEPTGISLELLERLRPYLAESIMVLDGEWTITANLAPPGGLIGRGLGLGLHTLEDMHPDDAVQVLELGAQAFDTAPGWQGSKVVRMRTGDGSYGRYDITAINRFDDPVINGMVVRTREVPNDLTGELPGIVQGSAIEMLADLLPLGVLLLDSSGHVIFANANACGMLGREPEELKRDGLVSTIAPADRPLVADVQRRTTREPARESCTVRLDRARVERVECRFSSEATDDVTWVVVTLEDVTERHAQQQELEERANQDPLTGLRNRTSLQTTLQQRLDQETPTTVAYLDLDGFKAVNDTWGHERGDELLVAIADALRDGLGARFPIARIGGDEFVVVADGAGTLARDLADLVADAAAREGLRVTCSIGTAVALAGDSPRDVLRRADKAMYRAKAERR